MHKNLENWCIRTLESVHKNFGIGAQESVHKNFGIGAQESVHKNIGIGAREYTFCYNVYIMYNTSGIHIRYTHHIHVHTSLYMDYLNYGR